MLPQSIVTHPDYAENNSGVPASRAWSVGSLSRFSPINGMRMSGVAIL